MGGTYRRRFLTKPTDSLSELLRAGTIPVILTDGFVRPLSELSGPLWTRCTLHYPESFLPHLTPVLRNFTTSAIEERMAACSELYGVWSAGRGRASDLRKERFEAVLRTIGARLGL